MKKKLIILSVFLNCLISYSQGLKTLEKEISQILKKDVPYAKSAKINQSSQIIIFEKVNSDSETEIIYNLRDIEIVGIEESSTVGYGTPIGKYRLLLTCNSGECISNKDFVIIDGKKLFKKMWKNDQTWFYFNNYSKAEIFQTKLIEAKHLTEKK